MECMFIAVCRRCIKYVKFTSNLCMLLQDDHKLSLEELSARYEVDLFKVRLIIFLISSTQFLVFSVYNNITFFFKIDNNVS